MVEKVQYAPLRVPFKRRRQTAAVVLWACLMPILVGSFLVLMTQRVLWPFVVAYILFVFLDPAPESGGRKLRFIRRLSLWKWMSEFFPTYLIKTAELDPSKNYVFGYHPHGIISLGAWCSFATEANGFSELFPGLDLNLLTLNTNFHLPFSRDFLLAMGLCSVSKKSCDYILNRGPGRSIMIVIGGAAEALNAFPGTNDLVIKKRLGFIKLALRNGSSLVPVFGFGENDLWDQVKNPKGSTLRSIQSSFQSYMSFSPPLFHGRGIFTYNYGILPFRKPVYTVVGEPVHCPKIDNPTTEQILEYQKKYLDSLTKVYEDHKNEYAKDRTKELTFIE